MKVVAQEVGARCLALLVKHDLRDLSVLEPIEVVEPPSGRDVRNGLDVDHQRLASEISDQIQGGIEERGAVVALVLVGDLADLLDVELDLVLEGLRLAAELDRSVRVETAQSLFTSRYESGQTLRIPIAHHDGNYFADDATLDRMEEKGQIALRYCDPKGAAIESANPNGSIRNIAGVFNETKTVLGMMPHPERLADPALGGTDGRGIFDALVEALS